MLDGGRSKCHHSQGWGVPIASALPLPLCFLLLVQAQTCLELATLLMTAPGLLPTLPPSFRLIKRPWKSLSIHHRYVGLFPRSRAHSFSVMESATGQSTCPAVDLTTDHGSICSSPCKTRDLNSCLRQHLLMCVQGACALLS